jgi:hypothetical protein
MSDVLIPCEACGRHLRASCSACPFCDAARAPMDLTAPTRPATGLSRAAIFTFGATLGLAGCGTTTPPYGVPALDVPLVDRAQTSDAPQDAGTPQDTGSMAVRYGGAPPPDASSP